MKMKIKAVLVALLTLTTLTFISGCSAEQTPYEVNDSENYTVSVKYDANGGVFTTNTSVIVDSYNVSEMNADNGMAEIALIAPDNEARGNDAFTPINNGYFLAGWYAGRTESTDSNGNTVYTYSDKWDFEKDMLAVDTSKTYSSAEPVLTLYAAWVPLFEVEFYALDTGEYLDSITFDPTLVEELTVPSWDEETGAIEMYDFPERSGYTFNAAYYDAAATQAIDTATVNHPGKVDYASGTATDSVMQIYVDWVEGEWYHIYNVEQFLENASVNGNYEIHADLDFAGEIWPTSLMHGNFGGVIHGNGYTLKNIEVVQTNNSKINAGLFGYLTETAEISDVTFENVNFTIKSGTRVVGTCYGLLAGTISNEAQLPNVQITSSSVLIDSSCYFGVEDYSIGLLCGMGNAEAVPNAEITCATTGDNPESINITVDGNTVTLEFVTE
ncbi:MAG: hypothetical protein IJZ23_05275 [Roseburia sp.]|nr:hypothetical protein [Roseburia sp.]